MATPRKRSTSDEFVTDSMKVVESVLTDQSEAEDETLQKMFETIPQTDELPTTQVVEEITPTADPGPRFVDALEETPQAVVSSEAGPKGKRQHPRNIPKFSRLVK